MEVLESELAVAPELGESRSMAGEGGVRFQRAPDEFLLFMAEGLGWRDWVLHGAEIEEVASAFIVVRVW